MISADRQSFFPLSSHFVIKWPQMLLRAFGAVVGGSGEKVVLCRRKSSNHGSILVDPSIDLHYIKAKSPFQVQGNHSNSAKHYSNGSIALASTFCEIFLCNMMNN